MEILKLKPAEEIGATSLRINNALAQLRNDLATMRSQDVDLMRRLIGINETLQTMSRRRGQSRTRKSKKITSSSSSMPACAMATPESYPRGCYSPPNSLNTSLSGSLHSIEDDESGSMGDQSSTCSDSEFEDRLTECASAMNVLNLVHDTCRNSESYADCFDSDFPESKYEYILKTNVKLWKCSVRNKSNHENVLS